MTTTLPRGNLPPITFAEKSATAVEADIITGYEAVSGRTLSPGDPVRLFLEAVAAIIINQRAIIDFAGKQNLLSYAQGDYIDYLGELVGVTRLAATPSVTTLQFTLSSPQGAVFTIPAGTQAAAGDLIFETTEVLDIGIGETTGTVTAECTTAGTVGNDLLPGQIRTMVEPIAYVSKVENTTTTNGGAEVEGDESLVDRIRLAPASFSVAGPRDAYVYWTLSANQSIIDVAVSSPSPGVVDVRPLMVGGALPGVEVLDQVEAVLSADNVRPLTDDVQVQSPTGVSYTIDVQYWIRTSDANKTAAIQSAVQQAADEYALWQKTAIGRDINPDELVRRMIDAGAKRVMITSPTFTVLDETQVAQETSVTVAYQGLEDA